MTENMKKFMDAVEKDQKLREKLERVKDLPAEEKAKVLIALAQEQGVTFVKEDFMTGGVTELSDDELEGAAGGGVISTVLKGVASQVIYDAMYRGGQSSWEF